MGLGRFTKVRIHPGRCRKVIPGRCVALGTCASGEIWIFPRQKYGISGRFFGQYSSLRTESRFKGLRTAADIEIAFYFFLVNGSPQVSARSQVRPHHPARRIPGGSGPLAGFPRSWGKAAWPRRTSVSRAPPLAEGLLAQRARPANKLSHDRAPTQPLLQTHLDPVVVFSPPLSVLGANGYTSCLQLGPRHSTAL